MNLYVQIYVYEHVYVILCIHLFAYMYIRLYLYEKSSYILYVRIFTCSIYAYCVQNYKEWVIKHLCIIVK